MSKLADAIRRTLRTEAAPMGFAAARPAPKASMLVGALGEATADVIVLDGRTRLPAAADIERVKSANASAAIGLRASSIEREQLSELRKAGLDFLLFEPEATSASVLLEDEIGYVMTLPAAPEESFLRSLSPLNLDAFYLEDVPSPLTVARQLELTRIGVFGGKPVLARVSAGAGKADLECLRAAGVAVLLVEDAAGVESLKETVMTLPPRKVRRDERPVSVALPRSQPHEEHDDDDDD